MNLTKKNYEIIAEELERILKAEIIKPGDKLDTIENLAKQYHVGRSTIREALSHLKAKGLVESRQGGGTYVRHHPLSSLQDIQLSKITELTQLLQVRKIIEVGCIELAAQLRTPADVEDLERIVLHMKEVVGNEELSQIYDVNFHLAIAKATKNPFLQMMMESISTAMSETIRVSRKLWLYSEEESAARLFEEHQRMLQCIIKQDPQAAAHAMQSHIAKVEDAIQEK